MIGQDTVIENMLYCDKKYRPIGQLLGVSIGDNSFIGTGCIIMPGAKIGKNVIIGAGSVVRGNIEDYAIVVGNPCKITGDTRTYCKKKLEQQNIPYEEII